MSKVRNQKIREWQRKNPEQVAYNRRKHHYKSFHGTTIGKMELMLKDQDGKCVICKELIIFDGHSSAVIDHDHESKLIRGILCQNCNRGLGGFKDNITNLFNAINYLNESKKVNEIESESKLA